MINILYKVMSKSTIYMIVRVALFSLAWGLPKYYRGDRDGLIAQSLTFGILLALIPNIVGSFAKRRSINNDDVGPKCEH